MRDNSIISPDRRSNPPGMDQNGFMCVQTGGGRKGSLIPDYPSRNNRNASTLVPENAKNGPSIYGIQNSRSLSPEEFVRPGDFSKLELPPVFKYTPYGKETGMAPGEQNPGIICGANLAKKPEDVKLPDLKNRLDKANHSNSFADLLKMQEKDRKKAIDNLTLKQLETLKLIELGQDKSDTFQRKPVNTGKGKQIHNSPVHNDAPKLLCSNQVVENNS